MDLQLILILLMIPIVTASSIWFCKNLKMIYVLNCMGSLFLLSDTLFVVGNVLKKGYLGPSILNHIFYLDAFSTLVLLVTAILCFLVSIYSISYMNIELQRKVVSFRKLRIYFCLLHGFIFTMLLTLVTQNMGLLWIAIEATTLASAFLVGFYNQRKSIEAAWKYIMICSVGIAFALLGVILLYYSSSTPLGHSMEGLNWTFLHGNAKNLESSILKISFIFILLGFGTKVGLAPMHTWLPDAHSQAPAPISALLSGVLLNTAMYAIVRVLIIVNKNLGNNIYAGRLMMGLGLLSIGTAAVFVLVQKDFKRILAYSSIEHMGIIAFGFGMFTPLSIFGSLFHIVNHAFTKSMLFMASGSVFLKYDTKKINKVKGVISVMPVTGIVFLMGIFAITGMPPFGVFTSEISIVIAAFKSHPISGGFILLCLIFIFAGFMTQLIKMFYGKSPYKEEAEKNHPTSSHGMAAGKGELDRVGAAILLFLLIGIFLTGLFIPAPIAHLIDSSKNIILGGQRI